MSNKSNIWEKYRKLEPLGVGVFGNVYRAKYNNKYFAIKEIQKISSDVNKFSKAIRAMKKMECDNSVKIIESFVTKDSFYIVSELYYLNLGEYLKRRKKVY